MTQPRLAVSILDKELACDLRRTVLCGELHWERDAVRDTLDAQEGTDIALVFEGEKPVATARLVLREGNWLLELLAVLPAQRRRGLGRLVADFLAARALERGALELGVLAPQNLGPFFQTLGFALDHENSGIQYLKRDLQRRPPTVTAV